MQETSKEKALAESELGSESPPLVPCKFKLVRELAARGSGGAHSVLQANQAEPNGGGGERGDVYSTVYRHRGASERGALRKPRCGPASSNARIM